MNSFKKNILKAYGRSGSEWLAKLPIMCQQLTEKWKLQHLEAFQDLSWNFVAHAQTIEDGMPVVLKIIAHHDDFQAEKKALEQYAGAGAVMLYDADYHERALLLECAVPGKSLADLFPARDDEATRIAAGLIKQLCVHSPRDTAVFDSVETYLAHLAAVTMRNQELQKRALEYIARYPFSDLAYTQQLLLHGDLHHHNIISSERGWIAIDPKGVIGPRVWEVGAFMRNPVERLVQQPDLKKILSNRLDLFADLLAIERNYLQAWSFITAVVAAQWAAQDADPMAEKFEIIALELLL